MDVLSRPATANRSSESLPCAIVSFNMFVFSAGNSARTTPHGQKDFPFALCLLQTLH